MAQFLNQGAGDSHAGAPCLVVDAVSKSYSDGERQVDALRNVSLAVSPGEFVALVGPSGSGKSTLLHLAAGLDRPDSGGITVLGFNISELDERECGRLRNGVIGMVFQDFSLLPSLTALENVRIALLPQKLSRREKTRASLDMLARVGLSDRVHHRPSELSGGQKQRVAVARALAGGRQLILADEPTANLDSDTAGSLLSMMKDMAKTVPAAFLVATHDARVVAHADRVLRLG